MESQGVPGRIQITRATYEILRDGFLCEPRGSIEVKGKGPMETWFLEGGGRGTPAVSPVGCSVYQTWVRGPTALARICSSNVASPKAVNREVLDNELPRFSIPPSTSSMRRVAHHAAITALAPGGLHRRLDRTEPGRHFVKSMCFDDLNRIAKAQPATPLPGLQHNLTGHSNDLYKRIGRQRAGVLSLAFIPTP